MGAYLVDNPPVRDQAAPRTRWSKSTITGCTVLHTAEGVMDTVGIDTGAENVADWIRRRLDPGSYHDLVDSDSGIFMVPYHLGAYHDGTGSNGFATSLSFACKSADWSKMSADKRAGFLRQGALRFAAQQRWRKANGHPLTRLRYISKAQSDAGMSGLCCHGWRDPARRTDPGIASPYLFPFDEFLDACAIALGELMPDHPDARTQEDDDMTPEQAKQLSDLWSALTQPVIVGETMAASQRRLVNTTKATHIEVAGLRETVKSLAADRVDGDEIVRRVEDAIARAVVQVDVTFSGEQP